MRVVIRSFEDEDYRHVICEGRSEHHCDRVAGGASINLNHEKFYVAIEEDEEG